MAFESREETKDRPARADQLRFSLGSAIWGLVALGCIWSAAWLHFISNKAVAALSYAQTSNEWIVDQFGFWPYLVHALLLVALIKIVIGPTGVLSLRRILATRFSRKTAVGRTAGPEALDDRTVAPLDRSKPRPLMNWAVFAPLCVVAVLLGGLGARNAARELDHNRRSSMGTGDVSTVQTSVSNQSSVDLKAEDFTPETLPGIEEWIVDTVLEKVRSSARSNGLDPKGISIADHSSVYWTVDNTKLAVIRLRLNSGTRMVTLIGFKGQELVRVTCVSAVDRDFPVLSGDCGEAVKGALSLTL